ncbi:MAG: PAS domain S-box protein [Thermodesulfobacteriota bacterium]
MKHEKETAEQLVEELERLRRRVAELEQTHVRLKNTQEALRESETRLQRAMEASADGIWDWDISTGETYYSPSYFSMLGLAPGEYPKHFTTWLDLMHPEDREHALGDNQDCICGKTESFATEFRMLHKDGTWRWILGRGKCVARDPHGKAIRLVGTHTDITERKRAEEALRKAHDQLELRVRERTAELNAVNEELLHEIAERKTAEQQRDRLFNRSIDLLCVAGLDGFFKHVNPAWAITLGWTEEELLSRPWTEFVHPDDRPATESARTKLIAGTEVCAFENRYLTKDGTYRWLSWNSFPVPDEECVYAVARDVTERRKTAEALRKSEEFNRRLVDHAPFGIIYVSGDGSVEYVNPAAKRLGGVPDDQPSPILGRNILELSGLHDPSEAGKVFSRLLAGESVSDIEVPYRSTTGRETVLLVAATPSMGLDGTLEGAIVIFTDIAERKRVEEIQRETARFKAVADLAGGVAHNFNNLLHIVIGRVELALVDLEAGNYGATGDSLREVLKSSRFAAQVVRGLQTFARERQPFQVKETEVFDLSDIARQAVEVSQAWLTASEKEGRKVSLHTRIKDGCLVHANKDELFEVVVNLVRNAVEALPSGGDVDMTTAVEGEDVILRVKDTGLGIRQQDLGRLFNPFFTTKVEPGAGLSLATGRKVVGESRGRILADSVEGEGTSFTLLFPLAEAPDEPSEGSPERHTEPRSTILVIDDMEAITDLMKSALTEYGHAVLTALSGEEGIEIFKKNPTDVVICDLGMPGMNGWEVGKEIKEICRDRGTAKTPFFILTGWGEQDLEEERITESGVDGVIAKPIEINRLLDIVMDVLRRARSHETA